MNSKTFLLTLPMISLACGEPEKDETGMYMQPFCTTLTDGNLYRFEGSGGGSTSGTFTGRLITDASTDVGDLGYVANVSYSLENIDVGGTTQRIGRTDSAGYFSDSGAAGTWEFSAGAVVDAKNCVADLQFEVEVGRNTSVCVLLTCD